MKKIMNFIIVALGVMMMTTSCGMLSYAQGGYGYEGYGYGYGYGGRGTVQTTPNPNGLYVRSEKLQKTGTFVVGKVSYPSSLRWANMTLVKRGMMVYVYDGTGQLLNQYDMRIPEQGIVDVYTPTGLTGKALEVTVRITGGYGGTALVFVTDGSNRETYYLIN